MTDINFDSTDINTEFNFGLSGDFSDFTFTLISSGDVEYDFSFGSGVYIYKIFKSTSNSFNSVWADSNASLKNGRFYVGREDDLSIINNKNGQIISEDYYSTTIKGSANKTLKAEDAVDINVTY